MNPLLSPWSLSYAEDIARGLNNRAVQDNLRDGLPLPYTGRDAEDYIRQALAAPPGSQYAWAILAEGRAAGSIGIFRRENIHRRTAELGYWLAQPYWGRGIVTAAVTEACRRVFADTDLLRIFAMPYATNAASCRVLEKAGFACEGTLRKNAVKSGRVLDMKLYALVK